MKIKQESSRTQYQIYENMEDAEEKVEEEEGELEEEEPQKEEETKA